MGETTNQPFQLSFNAALKVEFQGSRVTSDGGLILRTNSSAFAPTNGAARPEVGAVSQKSLQVRP